MEKQRITIIENEKDLAESVSDFLVIQGFETSIFLSGESAIEHLLTRSTERLPDIIICDLNMHGMNGYEVLDIIKENKRFEYVPFLFLTGSAEEERRREGMIRGADDFITKPFKYSTLIGSIKVALEKSCKRKQKIRELSDEVASQLKSMNEINYLTNHAVRSNLAKILQTLDLIKTAGLTPEEAMPILNHSAIEIDEVTSQINDLIAEEKHNNDEGREKYKEIKCKEVVLVDDDEIQIMLNKMIINKCLGPENIVTFTSGEEAVEYLKDQQADLMFLDINMPGMSGMDVLGKLQQEAVNLPVIMLSSSMDPKQINQCYSFENVAQYLVKPLKPASIEFLQSA